MLDKLPDFTKNFYLITAVLFVGWMLFFDTNDVYSQYKLKQKLHELESQKVYYEDNIIEVRSEREALLNDEDLLEKFAREKYFMKKSGEDLFVIVEEEDK
jgi:cell division protein FtsB